MVRLCRRQVMLLRLFSKAATRWACTETQRQSSASVTLRFQGQVHIKHVHNDSFWTGILLEASYTTSLLHLRCELTITHSLFLSKNRVSAEGKMWHRSRRSSHPDFLHHLKMQRRHAEECQMFGEVMPSAVYVSGCVSGFVCACVFWIYVYVWMSAEALCSWLCFLVQICKSVCVCVCVCLCVHCQLILPP